MKSLFLLVLALPTQLLAQTSVTLRHINIVDVKTGAIHKDQLVLIKNQKIDLIVNDNNKQAGATGEVVDGTNKFLIPGLWDMHTHYHENVPVTRVYKIPSMLVNGVTGVRNMFGTKEDIQLRDSVNKNLLIAPREIVASPLINGPGSFVPGDISISNASRIPILVDSLQKIGYDFIKVYSFLRSDLFFELAKYCRQKNMPIAGHVPLGITAEQASAAGLQSFEHMTGLRKSFSGKDELLLNRQLEKEIADASGYKAYVDILFKSDASLPFDSLTAKKIVKTLKANHTAITPTIVVFRGWEFNRDSLMRMPSLAYVSKSRQQDWYNFRETFSDEKDRTSNALQLLSFLHKEGMMILAGTDNENPFVVDGFSLHDELEYYVEAGLTPLEALQTATLNPAIFLHKEKDLGTVAKGKFADLVVLDKNPLADIKNTRTINAVIINGHLISKTQIEQSLNALKNQ